MRTSDDALEDLLSIAHDMTTALSARDRSERLVDAVARALPCDAVVLLRLEGDELRPLAARGLAHDLLGRRFARAEHPRLDLICVAPGPTVFPSDSELPDPYDGLLRAAPRLQVHACLGCPLRVEGELVGVLTADASRPGAFDRVDPRFLGHLAALAAATMRTSDLIEALEANVRHQGIVARELVRDGLERRGGLLVGDGPRMARLKQEVELVARSDFPVLVSGETGVGKELVVRMLHSRSPRADRPLVYVNCAALPESIVESELFGHVQGAFTGASDARPGKFRVANDASLLLDEVGELPLHVQPKLLRVLQDGETQPVGSDHTERTDVRVFAATNRDLESEVLAGRFRADLLHRLDICRIRVPSLSERPEDVPALLEHLAERARRRIGTGPVRFDDEARSAFLRRTWPGNVRELGNAVSRGVLRASARATAGGAVRVELSDLVDDFLGEDAGVTGAPAERAAGEAVSLRESVRDHQRRRVRAALRANGGNWAAAARSLGMHRSNLHRLSARLGLR